MLNNFNIKFYVIASICFIGLVSCGKSKSPASDSSIINKNIVTNIKAKIALNKTLKNTTINVQYQNNAIVLKGTVETISQKDQVEQIAIQSQKEVNQPFSIQDNIMVKE